MADDKYKDTIMAISTIVIVLTALGVTIFSKDPLKVLRPVTAVPEPAERVRARLWQDPFFAVIEYSQSQSKEKADPKAEVFPINGPVLKPGKDEIGPFLKGVSELNNHHEILVLGIMVDGGPYESDTEARIRYRVAVLSALQFSGYYPQNSEYINFLRIKSTGETAAVPSRLSDIIPYEWLEKKADQSARCKGCYQLPGKVLLLWLNDASFNPKPLAKLHNLINFLKSADGKISLPCIVVGPPNSTKLDSMIKELEDSPWFENGLLIYSPFATLPNYFFLKENIGTPDSSNLLETHKEIKNEIKMWLTENLPFYFSCKIVNEPADSNKLVLQEPKELEGVSLISSVPTYEDYYLCPTLRDLERKSAREVHDLFSRKNITFQRTIVTDLELAYMLIEELKNRDIDGPENHLILISEWDTKYGSNLPEIFHSIIKERTEASNVSWVHMLSYLRGLDGIVPGSTDSSGKRQPIKAGDGKKTEKNSQDQTEALMQEEPVGRSQLDYLRRLADNLYLKDGQLQAEGQGRIRAVGILGTDFYDKYLVLQAFKQRFPAAVFFTTDLDARLLHEVYNESTRNLIVASGYDLQPPEKIAAMIAPHGIAPFRSSYQTAIFCTIFQAFNCSGEIPPESRQAICDSQNFQPGLFEIGHQCAVNLQESKLTFLPHTKQVLLKKHFLIIAFIVLAIGLFWINSLGLRKWVAEHLIFFLVLLPILICVGYLFFSSILSQPSEEPFSISKGISIWPTAIIRLLTMLFSFIFLLNAKESIRQSDNQLAVEFSFDDPVRLPWHRFIRRRNRFCPPPVQAKYGEISINTLWQSYQEYNSGSFQLLRVTFITLMYMVLPYILFNLFGFPLVPVRGPASHIWDRVILFASIILFLLLTFFVFDTTRLLRWFLNAVLNKQFAWEPESRAKFVDRSPMSGKEIDYWMLIRLVAQRTETVNKLIFYPFIVWLMLFVSRWLYFDNWTTTPTLAIVIAMGAFFSWSSAILLNRAAEKLRLQIIASLNSDLIRLETDSHPNNDRQSLVKGVIAEVKNISQGAFTPFFKNPVVQALFVPFGGVGSLTLLEFLNKIS